MDTNEFSSSSEEIDYLTRLVGTHLKEPVDGQFLARSAHYSRFHFQRWFRQLTGEPPGRCRRRLCLERAGYLLLHSQVSITSLAFDVGYQSLEGFSRAFHKAYGVSPSQYRRNNPLSWFLSAPNDIHYDPVIGAAIRLTTRAPKGGTMDLTDRLIGHDLWLSLQLLEKAGMLSNEQLDKPLEGFENGLLYTSDDKTLREMLNRLVFTKEVWMSAVHGRPDPDYTDNSIAEMRKRLVAAYGEFAALVQRVRDEELWDTDFVDMLCKPPQTFTYGGMIAHVLTFSAFRRTQVIEVLKGFGVKDLGFGDPIEWERRQN
ncbi:MAG: AraC family transcriptional regulator [Anaerolineales bacterium]|jgi:AraC family transcriptional regulator